MERPQSKQHQRARQAAAAAPSQAQITHLITLTAGALPPEAPPSVISTAAAVGSQPAASAAAAAASAPNPISVSVAMHSERLCLSWVGPGRQVWAVGEA